MPYYKGITPLSDVNALTLHIAQMECNENSTAIDSELNPGPLGHVGRNMNAATYQTNFGPQRVGDPALTPYIIATIPPAVVVDPDPTINATNLADHKRLMEAYQLETLIMAKNKELLLAALPTSHKQAIRHIVHGFSRMDYIQLMDTLLTLLERSSKRV